MLLEPALERVLAEPQRRRRSSRLDWPSAIAREDLALARGERVDRAAGAAALEHLADDLGVQRRAAARDLPDRLREAVGLHDALLEQVADAGGAVRRAAAARSPP